MSTEIMRKLADAYKQVNESKFIIPEDIPVDERDMFMAKAAAAHKAGKSHFTMPNGKKHPVTMKKDTAKAVNSSANEAKDLNKTNADKAIQHDCATHVEHSEWGEGHPISGMHTIVETSPGQGYVTHYDIVFEHGIEKNVSVDDLTIISEMSHGHSKKKKNEMSSKEKMKAEVGENQKAALAKKLAKVSAPSAKGKAAVTLAPGDPTKKKREKTEVELNPKLNKSKDKEVAAMENYQYADWPIYKRIIEKAMKPTADKGGEHTKGATKSQAHDDLEAAQSNAQKMRKDHEPKIVDNPEASGDDVKKASNAGPSPKMRQGDNKAGDKKIINPAKEVKG